MIRHRDLPEGGLEPVDESGPDSEQIALEFPLLSKEVHDVHVPDAAPSLQKPVHRHDVLGVVVAYLLQGTVLPVLGNAVVHDRHGNLNVRVGIRVLPQHEVALQLADAPDAHVVTPGARVVVDDVLQRRPIVDAVVRVGGEVEAEVGEVVLFLALQRPARFHVEAPAAVENLCINEYLDVAIERLALDGDALYAVEVVEQVLDARSAPEVVDEVVAHRVEHRHMSHLGASPDVLLEDLLHDAAHVGPLLLVAVVGDDPWEPALPQVTGELLVAAGTYRFAEQLLHTEVLGEVEREDIELEIAPRELGDELAGEQVGVRAGDEDGPAAIRAVPIDERLEAPHVLYLVDEEVLRARSVFGLGVDQLLELVGSGDLAVLPRVEVDIDKVVFGHALLAQLVGDALHDARLAAAVDAGDGLDDVLVVVEGADSPQILLALIELHHGLLCIWMAIFYKLMG